MEENNLLVEKHCIKRVAMFPDFNPETDVGKYVKVTKVVDGIPYFEPANDADIVIDVLDEGNTKTIIDSSITKEFLTENKEHLVFRNVNRVDNPTAIFYSRPYSIGGTGLNILEFLYVNNKLVCSLWNFATNTKQFTKVFYRKELVDNT